MSIVKDGLDSNLNRICSTCGLSFGSHRADGTVPDQCPEHEGYMDWPKTGVSTFRDSGELKKVATGTPSRRTKA